MMKSDAKRVSKGDKRKKQEKFRVLPKEREEEERKKRINSSQVVITITIGKGNKLIGKGKVVKLTFSSHGNRGMSQNKSLDRDDDYYLSK